MGAGPTPGSREVACSDRATDEAEPSTKDSPDPEHLDARRGGDAPSASNEAAVGTTRSKDGDLFNFVATQAPKSQKSRDSGGESDQLDSSLTVQTDRPRVEGSSESRLRKKLRFVGQIAFGIVLAVTVVLAWPAAWGGFFTFGIVSGTSMLPQLLPGDLVVAVKNQSNAYSLGDTILYNVNYQGTSGRIVHTIVGQNPDGTYITQGVNKQDPDIWPVIPSDIRGRVVLSISNGQAVVDVIKNPNFIPVAFGIYLVWMFWPRRKPDSEETSESQSAAPADDSADGVSRDAKTAKPTARQGP